MADTLPAKDVASGLGVSVDALKNAARRCHVVDPGDAWTLEDVRKMRSHFHGRQGSTPFDEYLWPKEPEEAPAPPAPAPSPEPEDDPEPEDEPEDN